MKKKLIQEQREKAIIESFAKTFNKIKRLDENAINEGLDGHTGILIINLRSAADAMRVKNLLDSQGYDGEGDDAVFAVTYGDGWWEPIENEVDGEFGVLFSVLNVEEAKKIINTIFTIDSKSPFYDLNRYDYEIVEFRIDQFGKKYWKPIEGVKELDEINIGKGLATLGLAAALAGSPQKSVGQYIAPSTPPVQKTMTDTTGIESQPNVKAAALLLRSYQENPFTADMWAKQSKENHRLFKRLKAMMDSYMSSGRLEQEDLEKLGAMYKTTETATSFLNRIQSTK